jgi:hypothetical protein
MAKTHGLSITKVGTRNESRVYTHCMRRFSCFVFYSLPRKAANGIVYRVPFFVILRIENEKRYRVSLPFSVIPNKRRKAARGKFSAFHDTELITENESTVHTRT